MNKELNELIEKARVENFDKEEIDYLYNQKEKLKNDK
jgi:hypothetical protein